MKYIKGTLAVFVVSLVFSAFSVDALRVVFNDITIPTWSGIYTSAEKTKEGNDRQYITKENAIDSLTGDGREIKARTYRTTGGSNYSTWITAPKGQKVTWGDINTSPNFYKLQLKSNKSLPTTAGFWGVWEL